ncbi:hypothetical protein ACFOKI_01385 [Sphingomonas qilianensis]|uniref:Uncharacterized protein n=1 Tax=Sphingomonas qilianensis TaxID=1736690 RepID=A0ABU9XSC8_9SPHN
MLTDAIQMGVPDEWKKEFAAGTVYRVGTLLFRRGKPGIIAHLNETAAVQQVTSELFKGVLSQSGTIASLASGPPGMVLAALTKSAGLGMQAVAIRQGEQIKAALGTLQSLQMASLVVSGIGIGVSVAGFAILSQKIGRVSDQVKALDTRLEQMAKSIDDLRREPVQEDFDRLRTACEQMDEAWSLSTPERQWRSAAQELHGLQNRFSRRVRRIVAETDEIATVEPFVEAFAMAGAARVSSRLAAGDNEASLQASESFAREFREVLEPIGAADILAERLRAEGILPGDARYASRAEQLQVDASAVAASYRDREAAASSTPFTLRRLEKAGISGRKWLEAARHETTEPLMFLNADSEG